MITSKQGNVLDIETGIIVHGCNSHGVMGSGIAKEVKARFPHAFNVYRNAYNVARDAGQPGLPVGSVTWAKVGPSKWIVNAVTQQDYGRKVGHVYVDYEGLYEAFTQIRENIVDGSIANLGVNFPLIGCGLANGDWNIVEDLIVHALGDGIEKTLWIFNP